MKEIKMKSIILKICLIIGFLYPNAIIAQPYIFYSKTDTTYEHLQKILRFNLANYSVEDFFPNQHSAEYVWSYWEPKQTYLVIGVHNWGYTLYNCLNTAINFDLDEVWGKLINEILFSAQYNKLYVFSNEYKKLSVFDVSSGSYLTSLNLSKSDNYNDLMYPQRNSLFSSDNNKIYFYNIDTNNDEQVWTYSLTTNEIINKSNLSTLGAHIGSDGYSFTFGRKGKAIIESGPNYNNPVKDFYYNLYDFDNNVSSPSIYHYGFAEAYFNGNAEFILIMDTHLDDSLRYYHTGLGKIYNSQTSQLVKTINVPAGGIIYTFDNYPNDIYYVKNIDTQPEIYNLTKLRLNSITPGLSLPYTSSLTITISGGLFTSSSQAYFNNQPRTTTYLSDTTLSIQLNAGDLSTVGNYPLWVSNYGSNSDTLTYSVVSSLPQPITTLVECVKNNGGGSYTAKFGYRNDNTKSVFVPVGANNKFSPSPENRGQPTIFLPGRNYEVFSVNFDGRNLVWNIFSKKATASKNSTPCP